jgi:hypothetical protein
MEKRRTQNNADNRRRHRGRVECVNPCGIRFLARCPVIAGAAGDCLPWTRRKLRIDDSQTFGKSLSEIPDWRRTRDNKGTSRSVFGSVTV